MSKLAMNGVALPWSLSKRCNLVLLLKTWVPTFTKPIFGFWLKELYGAADYMFLQTDET